MKKVIYLVMGAIASGKSTYSQMMYIPGNIEAEYLCSDLYKTKYFGEPQSVSDNDLSLKKAYRCADELMFFRLRELCSKGTPCIILEFCPTNRNKLETIKYYSRIYGYEIASYFIGTDSSNMNISRNEKRIINGADTVSVEKVKKRYEDAFNSILEIICISSKTYFIDNSTEKFRLVAYMEGRSFYCYESDCDWFNTRVKQKLNNQNC